MGMFDNLYDPTLRCPYCGEMFNLELQTKDYDNTLAMIPIHEPGFRKNKNDKGKSRKSPKCFACWRRQWFSDDKDVPVHPTTRMSTIQVSGDCKSPSCFCLARMRDYAEHGYISGFGRGFSLTYRTVKGIAVVPATITEKDSDTLGKVRKQFEARLLKDKPAMKSCQACVSAVDGEWGLAVLQWHWSSISNGFKVVHPEEAGS